MRRLHFVLAAKERGTTVIHIDPRFTRTSALAYIHAPNRAGSDIAFLGGLINYILKHDLWFREYVLNYTNLPVIIEDGFKDPSDWGASSPFGTRITASISTKKNRGRRNRRPC